MSETKEQFLENLASASLSAFTAYKHKALVAGESADMATSVGWCGAAEAVYAQALRDLREAITGGRVYLHPEDIGFINDFAAERGIDLDGGAS